jgi:hypothetical protein
VLTHETSIIGKLTEDEINYLQAKGFTYDHAVSHLVRGFITTRCPYILAGTSKAIHRTNRETSDRKSTVTPASIHSGDVGVMFYIWGEVAT